MPALPTRSDVHIDVALTNMSVAYVQSAENFFSPSFFPIVPVQKRSNVYFVYDKGDFNRDEAKVREPGTESAGGGYRLSTAPYVCTPYAFHYDLPDQTRSNYDSPLSADKAAVNLVTRKLLIKRDRQFASSFLKTGLWTGASGGTDFTGVASGPGANQFLRWDLAGSTPIEDFQGQMIAVQKGTGFLPNRLGISFDVYNKLRRHADFRDVIKYTQKGILTPDLIAEVIGIDECVIFKSAYNTAAEGQTASMSHISSKQALLAYVTDGPSIEEPSAGYTFSWSEFDIIKDGAAGVKVYRMEHLGADRYEGEANFDMRAVAPDCGVFFTSCIT